MEINFLQVLFQVVNFGVILFVLTKFLYKPIQKVLDERQAKINDGLKAAEVSLKTQAEVEDSKKKELGRARREAAKIIEGAKKDAKVQADAMLKDAKDKAGKEAAAILESAKSSAAASQKKQDAALKELTVATTKRLLSGTLSAKEVAAITNSMVSKLK